MWQEILVGVFIVVAVLIFLGLGRLKVGKRPVLNLQTRIILSLVLPLLLVLFFFLGFVLFMIILGILVVFGLISLVMFWRGKGKRGRKAEIFVESW